MSNPFFVNTIDLLPATKARAGDVESNFTAVEAGFDEAKQYFDRTLRGARANPVIAEIPDAATRAGKALTFDGSGNPATTVSTTEISNAQANAVAAAASAATALAASTDPNVVAVGTDLQGANTIGTAAANMAAILDAPAQAAAAAASASSAAASYDSFDDRYLGSKVSDPALDNDGGALLVGALYWNSAVGEMRTWSGSAWVTTSAANAVSRGGDTMTGNLDVPSINEGQLAGLRNKIINGNFDVWQRGTSFSNANGYTADRWVCASGGGISGSVTQQAFTPGQTDVPGEPSYFARLVTGGASGANFFTQRIEDVRTFAGQTVMLSFYAKADAAVTLDTVRMRQNFGSGGSTEVQFGTTSINVTTSWQKFTIPFTVPSISGKTLGASSYLAVEIRGDTLSYTLDLAQVQLELGTVATPFEHRPYGMELALCQRYYYRLDSTVGNQRVGSGFNSSATSSQVYVPFPVTMRTAPTALEQSGTASHWKIFHAATATVCSAVPTHTTSSTWGASVAATVASGLTTGQGSMLSSDSADAYLAWSADL